MRESNFSNPVQNKACVCISAAIYDRRALDCTATLPLINSLNHLAYLTSTSPRIREMVCLDGGLERLIRILRQVPRSPGQPPMRGVITKEMQAVWKWSLAFQCVVNIGVRGSETVRTRVVEAGMVPVAVRVLESYLRIAEAIREERKREARSEDAKARLERNAPAASTASAALNNSQTTPATALSVAILMDAANNVTATPHDRPARHTPQHASPFEPVPSTSRTGQQAQLVPAHTNGQDEIRPTTPAEAMLGDFIMSNSNSASSLAESADAEAISAAQMPDNPTGNGVAHMLPAVTNVEAAILSPSTSSSSAGRPARLTDDNVDGTRSGLLTNASSVEDFTASGSGSDGADEGELDAADDSDPGNAVHREDEVMDAGMSAEDRTTPRPPRRMLAPAGEASRAVDHAVVMQNTPTVTSEQHGRHRTHHTAQASAMAVAVTPTQHQRLHLTQTPRANADRGDHVRAVQAMQAGAGADHRTRMIEREAGGSNSNHLPDMIYREEEVLLSLQLLAYLSKYAHVRTLFHRDLATLNVLDPLDSLDGRNPASTNNVSWSPSDPSKKNVFCIAERYTLRSSRTGLSHFAAMGESRIAPEIQYWAGVIMRNACRKDEKQGGIRQCANMLCGKWEKQPREFAKCRRCRKAKYCSKQCQSKGWQMGHRFWCSARSDDEHGEGGKERAKEHATASANGTTATAAGAGSNDAMAIATDDEANGAVAMADVARRQHPSPHHRAGLAQQQHDSHSHLHQPTGTVPHRASSVDGSSAGFTRSDGSMSVEDSAFTSAANGITDRPVSGGIRIPDQDRAGQTTMATTGPHPTSRRSHANYGALAHGGPSMPSTASRRAVSAIPQHLQMPPHHAGDAGFGANRIRTVSTASSSADVSDVSEDEMERASRRVLASTVAPTQRSPAGGQITQLASVHTVDEISQQGDHQVRRRNGSDASTLAGVPTRTDLAGRPLPPPVIARHDGPATLDLAMTPDNDLLTLGGRLTPTATDDVETGVFGRGDFDQMIWRGRTPSLDDNGRGGDRMARTGGSRSRSQQIADDLAAGTSGSDDNGETSDGVRPSAVAASTMSDPPSMLNSALNLANQGDTSTPRFSNASLHAPVARSAHRYASVNSTPFAAVHSHSDRSSITSSSSHLASAAPMSASPAPIRSSHGRTSFLHEFNDWRSRPPAALSTPFDRQAADPSSSSSSSLLSAAISSAPAPSASTTFSVLQQAPSRIRTAAGMNAAATRSEDAFVVPSEIQNLFDTVEMQSTPRSSAVFTSIDMDVDG